MRFILFVVFILVFAKGSYCQKNFTTVLGTVPVSDSSSMDATEVTIEEYVLFIVNSDFNLSLFPNDQKLSSSAQAFFKELKKGDKCLYIKIIKNHSVLAASYGKKGVQLTKEYHRFVQSDTTGFTIHNPMVGVSYEQAVSFCLWRQENENKSRSVKLKIGLPPLEIYQHVNENIDSLLNSNTLKDQCLEYQYNFLHSSCKSYFTSKDMSVSGRSLVRVDRFKPNKRKLYNIQGNASEMTSSKGVATGGSFRHFAKESMNNEIQTYLHEEDWLGFRCYITYKE